MSLFRKKFDQLDVTWRIAIRKAFLVLGCTFGSYLIGIIIFIGLGIILISWGTSTEFFLLFSVIPVVFLLFGFLVGLFKALLDLSRVVTQDSI